MRVQVSFNWECRIRNVLWDMSDYFPNNTSHLCLSGPFQNISVFHIFYITASLVSWSSLVAQMVKNLPAM